MTSGELLWKYVVLYEIHWEYFNMEKLLTSDCRFKDSINSNYQSDWIGWVPVEDP
jgi:hypothetical protein